MIFLNLRYISEEKFRPKERPCWRKCTSDSLPSETSALKVALRVSVAYFSKFHCLKNHRKTYNGIIKDAYGNKLTTDKDKNNRLKDYFHNMLNCAEPEVHTIWPDFETVRSLNSNTSEITVGEVRDVIDKLKNDRSSDEDLIAGEMLKAMGETGLLKLTSVLNIVWQNEFVYGDWRRCIIVRIPKKYNLSDCSQCRDIAMQISTSELRTKLRV